LFDQGRGSSVGTTTLTRMSRKMLIAVIRLGQGTNGRVSRRCWLYGC
jgi:hypothetical protein